MLSNKPTQYIQPERNVATFQQANSYILVEFI